VLFELKDELQCALNGGAPDGFTIATKELTLGEQLDIRPRGRAGPRVPDGCDTASAEWRQSYGSSAVATPTFLSAPP